MTGPQDPATAGGDRLRAGHADRDQAIETLKNAFVHGRLTRDELDARTGQALAARTYADLAALTADIPPARSRPDGPGTQTPAHQPLRRAGCGAGYQGSPDELAAIGRMVETPAIAEQRNDFQPAPGFGVDSVRPGSRRR